MPFKNLAFRTAACMVIALLLQAFDFHSDITVMSTVVTFVTVLICNAVILKVGGK